MVLYSPPECNPRSLVMSEYEECNRDTDSVSQLLCVLQMRIYKFEGHSHETPALTQDHRTHHLVQEDVCCYTSVYN